jgi:GTP pyrophosphokinase
MTSVLSHEQVNVTAIESQTSSSSNTVLTHMTVEIEDLAKLGRVLERLKALPNVISAVRE